MRSAACRKHSRSAAPPRGYTVAAVRALLCPIRFLQVIAMRRSRFLALVPLTLALTLSACGNKGDLVKPNPAAVPPKTDAPAPATPAPDGTAKPQDSSGGH